MARYLPFLALLSVACTTAVQTPEPVGAPSSPAYALTGSARWADSAAREIERSTISGDVERMRRTNTLLDQALGAYPNDPLLLFYQGYALYREAGLLSGMEGANRSDLPLVVETARSKLQQSLVAGPMPETHALLASVLGWLISFNAASAPTLGPLVQREMGAAVASGPANPRVWLLRGIQSFYTQPQYGGGFQVAETQLRRAIELFATDAPVPPAPWWGKAEAYVWLGQTLQKENRPAEARAAYERALALQPSYPWVSQSLLPSLDKE